MLVNVVGGRCGADFYIVVKQCVAYGALNKHFSDIINGIETHYQTAVIPPARPFKFICINAVSAHAGDFFINCIQYGARVT